MSRLGLKNDKRYLFCLRISFIIFIKNLDLSFLLVFRYFQSAELFDVLHCISKKNVTVYMYDKSLRRN